MKHTFALFSIVLASGLSAVGATSIRLRDVTDSAGIRFIHSDGSSGRQYIVETVASGLGLIDFDGDGWLDILFLSGSPLPGTPPTPKAPVHALYRNNGNGAFTDVTARSGLDLPGYAIGGLSVGESKTEMHETLELVVPLMPAGRPRYLMGVGEPEDLASARASAKAV
mgnify:CR=1 FL=1